MPDERFEYVLLQRQPIDYDGITDHQLIATFENAEANVLAYEEIRERAKAVIIERARAREVESIPDRDYRCDVVSPESILVGWLPGRGPWERSYAQ